MPDLSPVVGPLADLLGPLVGHALGAFLRTTVGMATLGVVVAIASFLIAAQGSALNGALAALLAAALCTTVGLLLAAKRAVGRALIAGVTRAALGRRTVGLIFEHGLSLDSQEVQGARGVAAARAAERVPLAQAEAWLRERVERLVVASGEGAGLRASLRRALRTNLLERVEVVTLRRFREEGAAAGGVDLVKVGGELAGRMDAALADALERALGRLTALLVGAAVLGSLAIALVIRTIAA